MHSIPNPIRHSISQENESPHTNVQLSRTNTQHINIIIPTETITPNTHLLKFVFLLMANSYPSSMKCLQLLYLFFDLNITDGMHPIKEETGDAIITAHMCLTLI